jgi:hypothetical protein
MNIGSHRTILGKSDLATLSVPLKIISSNPQKANDIALVLGEKNVSWCQYEPKEYQATKRHDELRLLGPRFYSQIARESALEKYDLIKREFGALYPGHTILDSSLWQVSLDGLPGLNAAQMFATGGVIDADSLRAHDVKGRLMRSEMMLKVACQAALDARDRRIYWIETAVTAELSMSGEVVPAVRQRVGLCFTPRSPWHEGSGMWPITCPNPIKFAELRGDKRAVKQLSTISDSKWELPKRAEKISMLVPFADMSDDERVLSSPRGDLCADLAQRDSCIDRQLKSD